MIYYLSLTRPVGQAVKTLASHAENMGSIPVRVTNTKKECISTPFFVLIMCMWNQTHLLRSKNYGQECAKHSWFYFSSARNSISIPVRCAKKCTSTPLFFSQSKTGRIRALFSSLYYIYYLLQPPCLIYSAKKSRAKVFSS